MRTGERIIQGEDVTLAFLGDSVTEGCFEFTNGYKDTVRKPELVYHALLKNYIRETYHRDVKILNAGVSGNFSGDGRKRLQRDVIDHRPDFCCVMFGTNDVTNSKRRHADRYLKEYEDNMRAIGQELLGAGIDTVFMTPGMLCTRKVPGFRWFWGYVHSVFCDIQNSGRMDRYVEAEKKGGPGAAYPGGGRLRRVETDGLRGRGYHGNACQRHESSDAGGTSHLSGCADEGNI